jgi:hypothetical protein
MSTQKAKNTRKENQLEMHLEIRAKFPTLLLYQLLLFNISLLLWENSIILPYPLKRQYREIESVQNDSNEKIRSFTYDRV